MACDWRYQGQKEKQPEFLVAGGQIMQKVLPSLHMLEIFMPVSDNEPFLMKMLQEAALITFYKGFELPVIEQTENQRMVRSLAEQGYQITQWASPRIIAKGYNLSSLDQKLRAESTDYAITLIKTAAESGTVYVGLPSGDYPGDEKCEDAKKALFESYCRISEAAKQFGGLHLTMEPLDRYVHKKQLMGPIHEVMQWFKGLKQECPNFYIHWDSAHEALAGIDLIESLEAALPYMAQFHICNCVTDPKSPYYGDYHMELGAAPQYRNWGYLTPEIGADMLRRVAAENPAAGVRNTHVAVEVRTHMGNDMWKCEREIREFLMQVYDLAGLSYDS